MQSVLLLAEENEEFDPTTVTPGPNGFFWTFLVAGIAVLLILDMTRRMRQNNLRERAREDLMAEAQRLIDAEASQLDSEVKSSEGRDKSSTHSEGTESERSGSENSDSENTKDTGQSDRSQED